MAKNFVDGVGITGLVGPEIENAGAYPEADLAREDGLQDGCENERTAHAIADQCAEEQHKTLQATSGQRERHPQDQ